jgi:hypothetical protein
MESILTSVKKLLGIEEEYKHFDNDLIIHINSVLMILTQMGVGPSEGFSITGADDFWSDFISEDFEAVKTYVHLKVRLMFDPPNSSVTMDAIKNTISELEWRLNFRAESQTSS